MEYIAVLAAAAAAWIFGAVWYMSVAKTWQEASALTEDQIKASGPAPYIVSFVCALLVAGMTRHILVTSGVETVGAAAVTGLGLGLFVAAPWIATNVMFSLRDRRLIWLDGIYPVVGMTIMGAVLALL